MPAGVDTMENQTPLGRSEGPLNYQSDGAILVVPDGPSGIDFGIDSISYTTGANFRGLSCLPSGIHFVYYSTGLGARQGFFINSKKGDMHVRPWHSSNEEIMSSNTLPDDATQNLVNVSKVKPERPILLFAFHFA